MLARALRVLGLTKADIQWVREADNREVAQIRVDTLKAISKENYRKAAKVLHPDVTQGDPDKTALFRLVQSLYERFQSLDVPEVTEVTGHFSVPLGHGLALVWRSRGINH